MACAPGRDCLLPLIQFSTPAKYFFQIFTSIARKQHLNDKTDNLEKEDRNTTILVKQAIGGDETSYKALYAKYAKAMYNICIRLLNHNTEAEDVLQESFIIAFRKLKELKDPSTFGGWLRRIVINQCHQQGRKAKLMYEELDDAEEIVEEDENWIHKVPSADVHVAIRNLPDGCRRVFLLYTSENYTHKAIADLLDITESTSKSQYLRARKLLQAQLKKRHG
jgi:RNA polymerase sigma-70 factor (ECF subfamily)